MSSGDDLNALPILRSQLVKTGIAQRPYGFDGRKIVGDLLRCLLILHQDDGFSFMLELGAPKIRAIASAAKLNRPITDLSTGHRLPPMWAKDTARTEQMAQEVVC